MVSNTSKHFYEIQRQIENSKSFNYIDFSLHLKNEYKHKSQRFPEIID